MASVLSARDLRAALLASLDALRDARGSIDAANVYPVPDADTGTNLVMTFEAVSRALAGAGDRDEDIAAAIAAGALKGARGNAGIIMAQVLRAWAEAVAPRPAKPRAVAAAFARAHDLAYEAVLEPAEGTILSVLTASARAASGRHKTVADQFAAATRAASEALARTPDQMPLLARSGVVDAGGMGLVSILTAIARTMGAAVDPYVPAPAPDGPTPAARCAADMGIGRYRYEVQYMLDTTDERVPALRQLLGTIGDSVAVVGGEGAWRVHVHTDDPGMARTLGQSIGVITDEEQVDFHDQVEAGTRDVGRRGIGVDRADSSTDLVVIAAGQGARRLFEELGARVIEADERMHVDAEVLIRAVDDAGAGHVILIPNHEEVFARASAALAGRDGSVTVLRAGDMALGLAAAVAFGDARTVEDNLRDMRATLERTRSGQVFLLPHDTDTPLGPGQAGQAIGFAEGSAVELAGDPVAVVAAVARALIGGSAEVVTVLCGAGVDEVERDRARATVTRVAAGIPVEVHDAGQPVHRYLVAAE